MSPEPGGPADVAAGAVSLVWGHLIEHGGGLTDALVFGQLAGVHAAGRAAKTHATARAAKTHATARAAKTQAAGTGVPR